MDVFNASVQTGGQTLHGDHAMVFYQIPSNPRPYPLVFLHSAGQSMRTWQTTPDDQFWFAQFRISNSDQYCKKINIKDRLRFVMVEIGEVDLYQQIRQQISLHKFEHAANGDNQPTCRNQLASQWSRSKQYSPHRLFGSIVLLLGLPLEKYGNGEN